MLTKQWTRKLPLIQKQPPARLAADTIIDRISEVCSIQTKPVEVVEFCAGGGGPTPLFEELINKRRQQRKKPPIKFMMTDIVPNIEAWGSVCAGRKNLSFHDQPVDVTKPFNFYRINRPEGDSEVYIDTSESGNGPDRPPGAQVQEISIFKLFNLSFHHLDDAMATKVLADTMERSDGIAIVELQDRRLGCLLMMVFNIFVPWLVTPFWFWPWRKTQNFKQIVLTYFPPVLPFILWWDGLASCIRTREFSEVMKLAANAQNNSATNT